MAEDWENELTPKPTMAEKLSALGSMLRHLPPQEEMDEGSVAYAIKSMLVIMSPYSTNQQRAACSMILDYVFPEWRERLSLAAVGAISDRNSAAARKWRGEILRQDGYRCVDCGTDDELEAHHIVRWADNVFMRVDPDNGKTLCKGCHLKVHGGKFH